MIFHTPYINNRDPWDRGPVERTPGSLMGDITLQRSKYHLWDAVKYNKQQIHLFVEIKVSHERLTVSPFDLFLLQDLNFTNFQWSWWMTSLTTASCLHASEHYTPALLLITGHEIVNYKFLTSSDNPLNCFQH